MSESSVGRSVQMVKFSIGARASSPRGLRDGLSLCFSLKLVLSVVLLASEKKRRKEEKIGEEKICWCLRPQPPQGGA